MAESEADTPSTPIEFESKYFEFDGVRLPPFCRGKMEEIADFSLRSSDIWIVTYPKSGPSLPVLLSPPCTLHVHISLRENSRSRIIIKANVFPSSITNINHAFFPVFVFLLATIIHFLSLLSFLLCFCVDITKTKCCFLLNTQTAKRHR